MSLFSKLFGGSGNARPEEEAQAEIYKGFRIIAAPIKEGGKYRIAARIEKDIDGEVKIHQLIRADTLEGADEAASASVDKAKKMIDEQGDRIF